MLAHALSIVDFGVIATDYVSMLPTVYDTH